MSYLALVHLHDLACSACSAPLAVAGARSFVVGADGMPIDFPAQNEPAEMEVELRCPLGHVTQLFVPNEIAAEEALLTPEEAPVGADAELKRQGDGSSTAI
jgi:hypothetical protein